MRKRIGRGTARLARISQVDWFLLLFMAVLLGHTVYSLFFLAPSGEASSVDVIVRTSAAAIFGYFLSHQSLRAEPSASSGSTAPPSSALPGPSMEPQAHAQLGFSAPQSADEPLPGGASFTPEPQSASSCSGFQVTIVSCIGLVSLLLLFAVRDFVSGNAAMTAAASQLRDFVSASVGFLVSCAKSKG